MVRIFQEKDKAKLFARLESRKIIESSEIAGPVRQIVSQVRQEGDRALLKFTERFDKVKLKADQLRVRPQVLRAAAKKADPALVRDLEKAIFNIYAYHKRQVQKSWEYSKRGVVLGQRVLPLDSVGVYVPGGSAAYPTSVLMNVIPAKIAGVPRIVVATPPGTFQQHPIIAAALYELNATEIYLVGGAQAVAALAYGTATIPRVDKIVGPGNAYVAAAKREVFGQVDIDMIAGPSEVIILASGSSNPRFIAADMLSQAEHDEAACSICFTDSLPHAMLVQRELEVQLKDLPRKEIARKSLDNYGAIVVMDSYFESVEWINEIAPEHLEIFSSIPIVDDRQNPECRVHFLWRLYAGSRRGLFRRQQPRPSNRRDRALFLAAWGLSFPAQDRDHSVYEGRTVPHLEIHRCAGARRGLGCPCPFRDHPAEIEKIPIAQGRIAVKKRSPLQGVKPQVVKVPAYTLHAYEAEIKLNQNENPFDFPEDLKDETFRRFRARQWSRYPDFVPDSLRQRLAEFAGWHKDGVLVGNGSNELLQATLMVLINSRTRVAIPSPTFTVYRLISTVLGAENNQHPVESGHELQRRRTHFSVPEIRRRRADH